MRDAEDGSWEELSLLEAAMVAGGLTDTRLLQQHEATFHGHVQRCRGELGAMVKPLHKTAAAFDYLHGQILTGGYVSDASDVAGSLTTGNYNCLSATILFQALCQALALPVEPVWKPAHVASCFRAPTSLLVETTLADWDAATSVEDATSAAEIRRLTGGQLIAKVYYNRGIHLMEQGRHAAAFPVARNAYVLDQGDSAAKNNLLACINNWALVLCRAQQYDQARALLAHGRQMAPSYLPFQQNEKYVIRHWERFDCTRKRSR